MSNEVSQQGANLGVYALMPTMTMGVGTVKNMRRWGKSPSAIIGKLSGANTNEFIQRIAPNADYFTKTTIAGQVGDAYKGLAKTAGKYEKKIAKAQANLTKAQAKTGWGSKGAVRDAQNKLKALTDKGTKAQEVIAKRNAADNAMKAFDGSETALKDVSKKLGLNRDIAEQIAKGGTKTALGTVKGFCSSVAGNFKQEISIKNGNGRINYLMTALTTVGPKIQSNVIPAFKNEGFGAGMKEVGKVIAQGAADVFGYAAGGAVGRTIGSAVGGFLGGILGKNGKAASWGASVGATLGDMIGSIFVGSKVCGAVDKVIGADESSQVAQQQANEQPQLSEQQILALQQAQAMQQARAMQQAQMAQNPYAMQNPYMMQNQPQYVPQMTYQA
ncbi:MAG: hypothetical protein IJ003_05495 [Candidatus Gastranaerophilales bacterium]|nr:hypothetical protein [Candidatus Gastranaerophilales bacterium]